MKTFKPAIITTLLVLLTLSLSSFTASPTRNVLKNPRLQLPSQSEYIIGEQDRGGFKVRVVNTSLKEIEFLAVNKGSLKVRKGYSLAPGSKCTMYFRPGEKCIVQNLSEKDIRVAVKTTARISYNVYKFARTYG